MVSQVAAVKTVTRRPWLHHVIIWAYILAPIANVALASFFVHVPAMTIVRHMFRGFRPLGAVWLLTAPLVGISLYFVARATWYVFLAHSSLVFVDFTIKWFAWPLVMMRGIPPLNNLLIVTGNLMLVALVGYVIQRDFRAPYFQALQRSFREHRRVPIRHSITLDGDPAFIDDLSTTGCFVPGTHPYHAGDHVSVSFRSETLTLKARGQVMRETPYGLGIRFASLSRNEKKDLAHLLKNRYSLRYKADLPAEWSVDSRVHAGRLRDVSTTGCYIAGDALALEPGTAAAIAVDAGQTDLVARGRVVWVNHAGDHGKPPGFGFRFNRSQRRLVRLVTLQFGPLERTR